MANDLENAIRDAGKKIAEGLKDISEMQVETFYTVIGQNSDPKADGELVARTTIEIDGDSKTTIPMRQGEGGLELDTRLLELHQTHVATAIEARTRILNSLFSLIQPRSRT